MSTQTGGMGQSQTNYGVGQAIPVTQTSGTYTMPSHVGPLTVTDLGKYTFGGGVKLPNKKISLTIHEANGGYVVTIDKGQYGEESDLYVIDSDKDLGSEIGKIITHSTLSK